MATTHKSQEPSEVGQLLALTLERVGKLKLLEASAEPEETVRERWLRQAAQRGCPEHRNTLDAAWRPRPTAPVTTLRRALQWSRERSRPHRRQPFVVVLCGPTGTGKSVGLVHAVAFHERSASFTTAHAVGSIPDSDWSEFVEARAMLSRVHLLAIDEAGLEHAKRGPERIAFILHDRYDRGLSSIVATNLDVESFCARYLEGTGEGAVGVAPKVQSRFRDEQEAAGLPCFYVCGGPDMRVRAAAR